MKNCPICKSGRTKTYFSNGTITLLRCRDCRVKFQHPMPAPEVLECMYSSQYYDSFYPEKVLEEQKLLFHDQLKTVERLGGGRKGKVLDVGSGRGMFIKAAAERGWDCTGQEFSKDAATALREKLGAKVVVCRTIMEAGLEPRSFDFVHLNHVLEHLYEPVGTLKEINRILKPGAFLYCEVPRQSNFLNLLSNIFGKKDFGFTYLKEHLFIYDIPAVKALMNASGFEILLLRIESIGDPHRYVCGVHYDSAWAHFVFKVIGGLRLQNALGGGNLVVIGRKRLLR